MIETFYPSEIVSLGTLRPWPRNYKEHDSNQTGLIGQSLADFGQFKNIVIWRGPGDTVDFVVAGHGLVESAKTRGWENIEVKRLPSNWSIAQVEAVLVADNRLAELSVTNESKLGDLLQSIRLENARLLDPTGFNSEQVDALLRKLAHIGEPGPAAAAVDGDGGNGVDGTYTSKIVSPVYSPSDEKPEVSDLFDDTVTRALVEEIDNAQELTQEERNFLKLAAQRHTVFNFEMIADYYAHSGPLVQKLMEDSALVIIDFGRAIELGFVKISQEVAALYGEQYGNAE